MTRSFLRWLLVPCISVATGFSSLDPVTIHLIGDSTCSIKSVGVFPETGWGMPFAYFFDESVEVRNYAVNGRSTKSFMAEGKWEEVKSNLVPGDYVFIQFGHNDEVPSKIGRYTTPEEFQQNLMTYVLESRSKGAVPILLTPVSRRSFENQELQDSHREYAVLMRQVAAELSVHLIDMTKKSMDLLSELGPQQSILLYNHLEAGEHPNYPKGVADNTHFNELGARKMAELVWQGMRELKLEPADRILKKI